MKSDLNLLENKCKQIRRDIVLMINNAQCGHLGGSLSSVEILVSLYFEIMNIKPSNPNWRGRDRFINSKGHATAVYYATLANRGYFEINNLLDSFININSHFEEHGDSRNVPGVDISTGSLGQGLSIGLGMAIASKLQKNSFKVYVLIGDGECQEGQIWEAAMFASNYKLDNLIAIIDKNRYQVSGSTENVLSIEPLVGKWLSFNWEVFEVDGHNIEKIVNCLKDLKSDKKPKVLIAKTIKGKGISFMERNPSEWHSYRSFTEREIKILKSELMVKCD